MFYLMHINVKNKVFLFFACFFIFYSENFCLAQSPQPKATSSSSSNSSYPFAAEDNASMLKQWNLLAELEFSYISSDNPFPFFPIVFVAQGKAGIGLSDNFTVNVFQNIEQSIYDGLSSKTTGLGLKTQLFRSNDESFTLESRFEYSKLTFAPDYVLNDNFFKNKKFEKSDITEENSAFNFGIKTNWSKSFNNNNFLNLYLSYMGDFFLNIKKNVGSSVQTTNGITYLDEWSTALEDYYKELGGEISFNYSRENIHSSFALKIISQAMNHFQIEIVVPLVTYEYTEQSNSMFGNQTSTSGNFHNLTGSFNIKLSALL